MTTEATTTPAQEKTARGNGRFSMNKLTTLLHINYFAALWILLGGAGNDYIDAGPGDDLLDAGSTEDTAADTNVLFAGLGNDVLMGGAGRDWLQGDGGDDILFGGSENDTLFGGLGNDTLYGEDGDDLLQGGDGTGGDGADALFGGAGLDTLRGEEGDDYLNGGADNDYLYGGPGADVLDGGTGSDDLYLDGQDKVLLDGADFLHKVDGANPIDLSQGFSIEYAQGDITQASIAQVLGSDGRQWLRVAFDATNVLYLQNGFLDDGQGGARRPEFLGLAGKMEPAYRLAA